MTTREYGNQINRKSYSKHREKRLAQQKIYRQTAAGKAVQAKKGNKRRLIHPERVYAKDAVWRAIKNGIIVRPDYCSINNCKYVGKIQAHHYKGYGKENRLDILWLCPEHHLIFDKFTCHQ